MNISFTSKNLELTEGLTTFISSKLSKFSSKGLSDIRVLLQMNKRKKGDAHDAVVELVGERAGKSLTVREQGETFYKAFFGAISKLKNRLSKEK